MKKYLKYLCIAIFLFIGFGINNVEAKSLYRCTYSVDFRGKTYADNSKNTVPTEFSFEVTDDSTDAMADDSTLKEQGKFNDNTFYWTKNFLTDFNEYRDKDMCPNIKFQYIAPNKTISGSISTSESDKDNDRLLIAQPTQKIDLGDTKHDDEKKETITSCEDIPETTKLIKQVYGLIKYLIPVLVIGLSIVDFLKVLLSGEEKVYKEAWSKFVKRLIIGVIILILPIILSFIINLSGVLSDYNIDGNSFFCIFS